MHACARTHTLEITICVFPDDGGSLSLNLDLTNSTNPADQPAQSPPLSHVSWGSELQTSTFEEQAFYPQNCLPRPIRVPSINAPPLVRAFSAIIFTRRVIGWEHHEVPGLSSAHSPQICSEELASWVSYRHYSNQRFCWESLTLIEHSWVLTMLLASQDALELKRG